MAKKKPWYKRFWNSTKSWWTHSDRVDVSKHFKTIKTTELMPGDIILFYYGNRFTEAHGEWMRSTEYGHAKPAPYHAAIVYDNMFHTMGNTPDTIILDPEISTGISFITEYLKQKRPRIDIVRFKASNKDRRAIMKQIKLLAEQEGLYDIGGYGAFASQVMPLRWVKPIIKPSKNKFFCSDAVTFCIHKATNIKVSPQKHDFTAPVDLLLYGLKHHQLFTLKKEGERI